jgi:porin
VQEWGRVEEETVANITIFDPAKDAKCGVSAAAWLVAAVFVVWPGHPVWAETQGPTVLGASPARAELVGGDSTEDGSAPQASREADQGEMGEGGQDPEDTDSAVPVDAVREREWTVHGPSSVSSQLERDREARRVVGPQILKDRLRSRYGLSLGVDFNVLAHQISESPGESAGVGGVARAYGRWNLVGRDRDLDVGALVFKVEYRDSLGTELAPQGILSTAGVAGISGPTFSDIGGVLTNLYWTQAFADNRVAFIAGVVDPTDYVDVYALVNPWTEFNNLAFSTSPTIAVPNQGLGVAALWSITPHFYVLGGLADANADPHHPDDFFSSFAEGEYFKHLELGLIGSWATRMSHNVHVLLWQVDDRREAGVEGGWGATFSWSTEFDNGLVPFLRGGYSDSGGILVDRSISAGLGYQIGERDDFFGFGANWGRAPDVDRNQYQLETYYRTPVVRGLSVVPAVQYIVNPAYDPETSNLWLLALRLRAVW